jgi:transcriptional regulator with XRE-family HTH domain
MVAKRARTPAEVFAERVKEARAARGWSPQRLAERLTKLEYPTDRWAVRRIEKGERADVRLSDLFAYALALDVAPVHLLVPLEDEGPVIVTEALTLPVKKARAWIRGQALLRGADPLGFFMQLPEDEKRLMIEAWLTGGMDALQKALVQDTVRQGTDEILERLNDTKEEGDGKP